ncbi:hypothetical protein [Burkholderia gladioli]|uniref:hypothetical protein n=1 Tax=Burkholderia gladioli TaxID=28095 RepID=UPI00163EDE46|nr:hypothetical protein [Burkholderia gladioli]
MSKSKQRGDAVAVVGTTYQLLWVGSGPIAPIVEQHGIKVGDRLYHGPAAEAAPELVEALQAIMEMCDGYVPNTSKAVWNQARAALAKAGA